MLLAERLWWSCHFTSAQGHAMKTNMTCAAATRKPTRKLPAHHPLRHLGRISAEARLRSYETFLQLAVVLQRGDAFSTASQSPRRAAVRGGGNATMRQTVTGSGCCWACNSVKVRWTCERIGIMTVQQYQGWRRWSHILVEAALHLTAVVSSAMAWLVRRAGQAGVEF